MFACSVKIRTFVSVIYDITKDMTIYIEITIRRERT